MATCKPRSEIPVGRKARQTEQQARGEAASPINVLWVIDHVCYDGNLHGGGRLYWNVVPRFDGNRFRIIPCLLRADQTIRRLFHDSPAPVRILDKAKFDLTTLWTFLRLIRSQNIHVLHLHCYAASSFGRLAALIAGLPAVIHDYDTEVYFPYPWYLRLADRLLAPRTSRAIAPSPMVRDFLVRKRRIEPARVCMMLHAIPPERYTPVPKERLAEIRRRLGIGDQERVVGTVTKLGPQRGNDYLLKAAAEVIRRFPNARFLLVYKPTYYHRLPSQKYVQASSADAGNLLAELKAHARALGLEANLRLLEWPEDVDEVVSACDLIAAPFLSERFSSVHLLEAMAQGKPLIATDLGEQREIIRDGVNGYLVPPGDAHALAERIAELLADPDTLGRMGSAARQIAQQYSVDAYTQRLESLYTQLAANGRNLPPEAGSPPR
jgi:glycosyltransferase involved in cell wall biosynthesis